MASYLSRSLLLATRQSINVILSRSYAASSSVVIPNSTSLLCRIRPLASYSYFGRPGFSTRGFATRPTTSSLNDPNPNWSNRPPKETILLDGCDFEHWLIVMEKPEGDPTRDEIIDSYIKTLAMVVGSEEEARMKIYSVSTRHYFAFGALVSEELSYKIKELPKVRWVLPDSYLDVKNKDYGGEPFINGQAVPYDPKYHEEWVRNNARANERNKRNDRPRNFDRSRNFERRRDAPMGNQNTGGPDGNFRGQPNMGGQPNYAGANSGSYPPNNYRAPNNPSSNQGPNTGGFAPGPNNHQGFAPNMGPPQGHAPNMGPPQGHAPNMGPPQGHAPNMGPPQGHAPNMGGGYQNQYAPRGDMPPPPQGHAPNMGGGYQNQYAPRGDMPPPPNRGPAPPAPGQNNYAPNMRYQGGYAPNMRPGQASNEAVYAPQMQNIPGRDSQH